MYLPYMPHTHHLITRGLRNIKAKPHKNKMLPGKFSVDIPKVCFIWKELKEYCELIYRFKIDNKLMVPCEGRCKSDIPSFLDFKKENALNLAISASFFFMFYNLQ
jgi:hypothetical protein